MVVRYLGDSIYKCLAADPRPINPIANATLIETDTRRTYYYSSGAWVEQQVPTQSPQLPTGSTAMTIYQSGSLIKVRNNVTGLVVHDTVDVNTGDASTAFNYAIANVPTSGGSGSVIFKGRINVMGGNYYCKSMIDFDALALGYHGVQLTGEGLATRLDFTPPSALPNAIRLRMSRVRLADLRLYASSNVTNLVFCDVITPTQVPPGGTPIWNGVIERVHFDAANYNSSTGIEAGLAEYKPGQQAIKSNGKLHSNYFWKINKCFFRGFEIAVNWYDVKSTSIALSECDFLNNRISAKVSGSQNNIHDLWIQGSLYSGDIGLWITTQDDGDGSLENINNIQIEMFKTADITATAAVPDPNAGTAGLTIPDLPKPGAIGVLKDGTANIRTSNLTSTSSPGGVMVDKGTYVNYDTESRVTPRVSHHLNLFTGTYMPGATLKAGASGILAGNILESVAPTQLSVPNGPAGRFSTSATINTPRYMYFSHTGLTGGDSMWGRSHNPQISVRFLVSSTGTNATAGTRLFIGLWCHFSNPAAITTPDSFLDNRNGVGVWLDTGVSGNYRVMHNANTATSSLATFDTPLAVSTGAPVQVVIQTDHDNNAYVAKVNGRSKRITSNIPASGHHGFIIFFQNTAGEDKHLFIYEIEMAARGVK